MMTHGTISPIKAKNIRVEVDPKHPVTQAMLDGLPRASDATLQAMLTLLRDGRDDDNTRSWRALVEGEIAFRKTEPASLVQLLLNAGAR